LCAVVRAILTSPAGTSRRPFGLFFHVPREPMNRRVLRQILIAPGVFAAIVLVFVLIAHFGG